MSYKLVDQVLKSTQFHYRDKMVLIALCSYAKNDGTNIFPSIQNISERAGMNTRTVIRSIETLENMGCIYRKNTFKNNLKSSNNYVINVDFIRSDRESHRCDTESVRSDRESLTVVTESHFRSDRESHKPIIESTIVNQPYNNMCESSDSDKFSKKNYYSEKFEEFWIQYPKKKAKGAAFKAYQKAIKKVSHEEIMRGVMIYSAQNIDPQYIKHPQGWLNDERWNDEYQQQQNRGIYATNKRSSSEPETYEEQRERFLASCGFRGEEAQADMARGNDIVFDR